MWTTAGIGGIPGPGIVGAGGAFPDTDAHPPGACHGTDDGFTEIREVAADIGGTPAVAARLDG
jgi:hypothetical protein